MKFLITGITLFISGVIGIASIIISCTNLMTSYSGIKRSLMIVIFNGFDDFNLAMPFILSIFLIVLGVVFIIRGFRDEK